MIFLSAGIAQDYIFLGIYLDLAQENWLMLDIGPRNNRQLLLYLAEKYPISSELHEQTVTYCRSLGEQSEGFNC